MFSYIFTYKEIIGVIIIIENKVKDLIGVILVSSSLIL